MKEKLKKVLGLTLTAMACGVWVVIYGFVFTSCQQRESNENEHKTTLTKHSGEINAEEYFQIVEIDSCEYIFFLRTYGYSGGGGLCHKANCKNH